MPAYLVDTDVIVAGRKGGAAPAGVLDFFEQVAPEMRYVPVQVIAQLRAGIQRSWRREAALEALALEGWLEAVLSEYAPRLLEFDLDCALVCARLHARGHAHGVDGQIAAMGIAYGLTVVSGRLDSFAAQGLRLENPFS
ncbi:VapC toxin family PIN domain ribonuclease [Janthinobacterium sp. PLB04]|uniref:VapC toxin family PIN domain ribonuclease n=1 Tax=Janthinobacterium lividum TaxID=29581 RepID=A0AAJ4MVC3_9BURK|nr:MULTISPECIES: type II toxin-antitoxin system VapC family toxin [Janthinobacterium]KAB0331260.1 type II toxin-antitoxin system VapC family toxin [Janthinobacterium lividum]QSX97451.1 VapC toxin family PIN domain ribonuclease [Janthinobacterium lividum]UGQ37382.1 VapC toxin family PIN domain ribonuclease [Janthinobacterium sp. PLB04]